MSVAQANSTRIVGVEEHFLLPDLLARVPEAAAKARGYFSRDQPFAGFSCIEQLSDVGEGRLRVLDEAGISLQVLSVAGPGADLLPPRQSVAWAREANDALAGFVAAHPDRFAGLAHLPLTDPDAAADELERCVNQLGFKGALVQGSTNGLYLDHLSYDVLLDRASRLEVPIYVHPGMSPAPARETLYGGLPEPFGFWMSISGWGWHADTAIHILRLMVSGAFDRHPGLQVVIGHLGEGLQILLPRLDQQYHTAAGMEKLPSQVLRKHVHVTMGGFFMRPSFMATLDAFGADRIMFSVDYPFGDPKQGVAFLESLPLSAEDRAKIAHQNADRLFKLDGCRANRKEGASR